MKEFAVDKALVQLTKSLEEIIGRNEDVVPMYFLWRRFGEELHMIMIPMENKELFQHRERALHLLGRAMKGDDVLAIAQVSEAWASQVSTKDKERFGKDVGGVFRPDIMPSEDPNAKNIAMVTIQTQDRKTSLKVFEVFKDAGQKKLKPYGTEKKDEWKVQARVFEAFWKGKEGFVAI